MYALGKHNKTYKRKYTRVVLIYGYLQLLIAAFKAGLMHCFVHQHSTKHVVTNNMNKQVLY